MEKQALVTFWKILNYENLCQSMDAVEAHETAKEAEYQPIDTRFCILHNEGGSYLLEASGTKIVREIEGGDL